LANEGENVQAFGDGETELMTLLEKMYHVLEAKKKRKCSLLYLQETVALIPSAYLQVKCLNESGARRKCQ